MVGFAILKVEAGPTYGHELWTLCTSEESLLLVGVKWECAEADRKAVSGFSVIKPTHIHTCIMNSLSYTKSVRIKGLPKGKKEEELKSKWL